MNDFRRFFLPLTIRKPESWAACPLRRDLTARHHDMLRQLPVVETTDQPLKDFLGDPPPRECVVRFGKHYFYFTISKILLIRGFLDKSPSVNYALRIEYGRKSFLYKPLQYEVLVGEEHLFKYKKSHIMKVQQVKFEIVCYRQNVELSIGQFELDLNEFYALEGKARNEVKNITKKNFIIGTISLEGYVKES